MYQQLLLTESNQSLLKIEQAIIHLKAGLPIIVDNNIVFSAQTVNHNLIEKLSLQINNFFVIIAANRANFLFDTASAKPLELAYPKAKEHLDNLITASDKLNKKDYDFIETKSDYSSLIELSRIAGLMPIFYRVDNLNKSEIVNIDGVEIYNYRKYSSSSLNEVIRTDLPLINSKQTSLILFQSNYANIEHFALIIGKLDLTNPIVRVHSSCFTGDLLGSLYCDCGEQFQNSIKYMAEHGGGIVLYLMQEGRSIGIANKLRCYNLQRLSFDTVEANEILGYRPDERDFFAAALILKKLNISKIKLLTNNPSKELELKKYDIEISETINLASKANEHNSCYLKTKASKMGHKIDQKLLNSSD